MSPESAVSPPWRELFKSSHACFEKEPAVVAIDEAHCIPEWWDLVTTVLAETVIIACFPATGFI